MNRSFPIVEGGPMPMLKRDVTWEEWEAGRAARRAFALRITGGTILRRASGNPRKDRFLRQLYRGDRGLPFKPI